MDKLKYVPLGVFVAAIALGQTPDLSGVWTTRSSPATRYLSYSFSAEEPSMTPWALEKFKATKPSFGPRAVKDSNDPVNPTVVGSQGCFPPGVPRIYLQPFPFEIVQTPARVLMIFEFDHQVRQIFIDGRPHDDAVGPQWNGDSIGRWDGDTLVVDTLNFNDKSWLDRSGHPHSEDLHVTERMRRPDKESLQIDIRIEDPKAYTKPWGGQMNFRLRPTWKISELMCVDNANFEDFLKNEEKPK